MRPSDRQHGFYDVNCNLESQGIQRIANTRCLLSRRIIKTSALQPTSLTKDVEVTRFPPFIGTRLGIEALQFHLVLSDIEAVFKLHLFPWFSIVYLYCMSCPCVFFKRFEDLFPPIVLSLNLLIVFCASLIRLRLDGPLQFLTNHLSRNHRHLYDQIKSELFRPPRPIFAWLIHSYINEDNIIF